MKVPLVAYVNKDGLTIVSNKQKENVDLPSAPTCFIKKGFPNFTYQDFPTWEKYTDLATKEQIEVFRKTFRNPFECSKFYSEYKETKTVFALPYFEYVLVKNPDYFFQYPNNLTPTILTFDLEVFNRGDGRFPKAETEPIIAIGYKVNDGPTQVLDNYDEKTTDYNMINDFLHIIEDADPDIIVGYNCLGMTGDGFDIPYLITRAEKHGLNITRLSRWAAQPYREKSGKREYHFFGRCIFDVFNFVLKDQCYDSETDVLTDSGWKRFSNLTKDDKVATLNTETDTLEYQKPIKLVAYHHTGKMYQVKSKGIDMLVTPNHNLYVQCPVSEFNKYQRKDGTTSYPKWELKKPNEVIGKRYKVKKFAKNWKGNDITHFDIPTIDRNAMEFNYKNNDKIIMNDWLEFLGYYLSEGSCYHSKDNGLYNINISQSMKKDGNVEKIRACIHRMGFKTSYYHDKTGRNSGNINFKSKQLYQYLSQFGNCFSKFIPQEFLQLDRSYLQILFDALMLGDGCVSRKNRNGYYSTAKYTTVSVIFADQVQELALKLGYAATIIKETSKNLKPIYRVQILTKQKMPIVNQNRKHDMWVDYNGMVYCCEVSNHIMMVRRNGYAYFSGNSLHGIKNRKLATVAEWYKIPTYKCEDVYTKNSQALLHTDTLRKHVSSDVEATAALAKIYILVQQSLAEMLGIPFENVVNSYASFIPKIFQARHLFALKICPFESNATRYNDTKFEAALTKMERHGLHKELWGIDAASFYPSLMRTFNLSPDTVKLVSYLEKQPDYSFMYDKKNLWVRIPDENFQKDVLLKIDVSKDGFLRREMDNFFDMRGKFKKAMKDCDDTLKISLKSQSDAVKVIMNSIFGINGLNTTWLGDMGVAIGIAGLARWVLGSVLKYYGEHVIAYDTDGIYIDCEPDLEGINKWVAELIESRTGVKSRVNFELKGKFSGYFHKTKNYVLRDEKGKFELHGVSMKSSRAPKFYDEIINMMSRRIIECENEAGIIELAKSFYALNQFELSEFMQRTRVTKLNANLIPKNKHVEPGSVYKNANALQPSLMKRALDLFGKELMVGDTIEYFKGKDGYILKEEVTNISQLDLEYYRTVANKALTIFEMDPVTLEKTKNIPIDSWFDENNNPITIKKKKVRKKKEEPVEEVEDNTDE
jgi:DNA polymerase elongation subunit (family B)